MRDERIMRAIIYGMNALKDQKKETFAGIPINDCIAWLEKQVQKDAEKQKFLIENIRIAVEQSAVDYYNITKKLPFWYNDALDWLKKQGEQKSTDKVKAKFNIGDWIVNNNSGGVCQITEIRDDEYCLWPLYGEIMGYLRIIDIDNDYHLWTISDAKDGDVIAWDDSKCIVLFKNIYDEDSFNSHGFVGHCTNIFESRLSYHDIEGAHPASKEQRDLLFSKIREAGYEWNSEEKKLKKIEQKFKEDDWIVTDKNNVVQIKAIENGKYVLGNTMRFSVDYVDKCWRKWDITKDAKDGDVLYSLDSNQPFIYKCRNNSEQATCYCGINKFGKFFIWNTKDCIITLDKYVPATLEQRDLLFRKMKEAGYLWDAENKQLLSLKAEPTREIKGNDGKKSPKWNEEDEKIWCGIIDEIEANKSNAPYYDIKTYDRFLSWLNNIKQRVEER